MFDYTNLTPPLTVNKNCCSPRCCHSSHSGAIAAAANWVAAVAATVAAAVATAAAAVPSRGRLRVRLHGLRVRPNRRHGLASVLLFRVG